ncbi:MAG: hypothetical protein JAY85_19940 [Candidatus Thiodiazotropha weberae]|uniref:hypothetical protein n=1 Tax=Candidatus Thiodiazotropha endoloripes TaxID=1818881 RepID=UPI00083D7125|nr:hypothetical protein [Candidatus Thiodiazotropha endoloripes]MCG7900718.1 hypothetical protein [Candidatus Thiodiazotropha weberae]ODB87698.1 hypothetical protein A3193_01990 [Candidatus Thiodiazotropha endoloripes]ODB89948.1 hypothetical protein A3195_00065 [Candidatus Thiodiazotropha endoloripes]
MNIEKLYSITKIIVDDVENGLIKKYFKDMLSHLQNSINTPAQPQSQSELGKMRAKINESLSNSAVNSFNIIDIEATKELGVDGFIGNVLRDKIEQVFVGNDITPSVALENLTELHNAFLDKIEKLTFILQGISGLNIIDVEAANEFKLIVRIPRELMDNNLSGFSDHLEALNENLLIFSEVSTGRRESLKIGSLSTTDPTLVLPMAIEMGKLLLEILASVAGIYGGVILLKQQKQHLIDSGAPEDTLDKLTEWINKQVTVRINEEIPAIVEKHYKINDEGRKNELITEARRKTLRLAENIDQGYTYDVKIPALPEEDLSDEELEKMNADIEEAIQTLTSNNKKLQDTKQLGSGILLLPKDDEEL